MKRLAHRQVRALERAQICIQNTAELFIDHNENIYDAEETCENDGDQTEAFSQDREKNEEYFDADGNFVEYVRDKTTNSRCISNIGLTFWDREKDQMQKLKET